MQNLLKSFLIITVSALLITSCKSKSDIGKLIPADALVASYFDTKSLLDKLPFEEVKQTPIFQDAYADSSLPAWSKQLLDDPEKAGIDLQRGLIAYAEKGVGMELNLVVAGFIKNTSDFESFNKNLDPAQTVVSEKNIKSLSLHDKSVVGWNDKNFVYVMNVKDDSADDGGWNEPGSKLPRIPGGNIAAAKAYLQKVFSLSESNSLAKDNRFDALMKEKGDVKMWLNNEKIFQLSPMGIIGMLKLDAIIKDSRTAYTATFENGSIQVAQKSYYGKEMTNLLKKYKGENVKADDFSQIPSTNILAAFAGNTKPDGIKEIIKLIGVDGLANMYLNQLGLSIDEVLAAIDGKFLVSFSDLQFTKNADTTSFIEYSPDFNLLSRVGIKDKAAIQKIIDAVMQASGGITSAEPPYVLTDKALLISNNKAFAQQYADSKGGQKPVWADKISGEPFGLYVNIQGILQAAPAAKDSGTAQSVAISRTFWKDANGKGGDFAGDALTMKGEINLQDEKTNSLKQLNTYFNELYKLNKNKIDSLRAAPANMNPSLQDSSALLPAQ